MKQGSHKTTLVEVLYRWFQIPPANTCISHPDTGIKIISENFFQCRKSNVLIFGQKSDTFLLVERRDMVDDGIVEDYFHHVPVFLCE